MKEMYFTIAGCNHYYGSDFMEKGMKVKLVKEPDNEYDNEAIQVKIKGLGKVGYQSHLSQNTSESMIWKKWHMAFIS